MSLLGRKVPVKCSHAPGSLCQAQSRLAFSEGYFRCLALSNVPHDTEGAQGDSVLDHRRGAEVGETRLQEVRGAEQRLAGERCS